MRIKDILDVRVSESHISSFSIEALLKKADLFDVVQERCKPFLHEINNQIEDFVLYRGISDISKLSSSHLQQTRMDRKPKDMPRKIHHNLDLNFLYKFGFKARSESLMCTGSYRHALRYSGQHRGAPLAIFPIDNFEFVWSPDINDLFETYEMHRDDIREEIKERLKFNDWEDKTEYLDAVEHELEEYMLNTWTSYIVIDEYRNDNLIEAINSRHEIMLNVKYYYYVPLPFPTS